MPSKFTKISDVGEFSLIHSLSQKFKNKNPSTIVGIGDDAAVIAKDTTHYTLMTTDMLIENIHFDLTYCPLKHLGYKAVVVNISDILAMNGTPEQITVSIAVSSKFSLEALQTLYEGIALACTHYQVDLIGGDTTAATQGLSIAVSAIGTVKKNSICKRSTAQPQELICVTGDLGAAYLGLQILNREKKVFLAHDTMQPVLEEHQYVIERQLKPEINTDLQKFMQKHQILPSAMIDISDGLSSELLHISQASRVGILLYEEKIPILLTTKKTALDLHLDPTICALHGGEDYELLFTLPQEAYEKIKIYPGVTVIGHTVSQSEGCHLITSASHQKIPLKAQGWVHY